MNLPEPESSPEKQPIKTRDIRLISPDFDDEDKNPEKGYDAHEFSTVGLTVAANKDHDEDADDSDCAMPVESEGS